MIFLKVYLKNYARDLCFVLHCCCLALSNFMMTSSNGSIFRVAGPLWGEPPVIGGFPSQRPVTRSFDVSLICAWTNGWINNRDAGDLRRHRTHYDVTVMLFASFMVTCLTVGASTSDIFLTIMGKLLNKIIKKWNITQCKKQTNSENHL